MKLHFIPFWTAALLLSLSLPAFAHGRGGGPGGRGGGGRGGGAGFHAPGGPRGFGGAGFRSMGSGGPGGRFAGPGYNYGTRFITSGARGFYGGRFPGGGRFRHNFNRGGGNGYVYGNGWWGYYPGYYGYGYGYNNYPYTVYPNRTMFQYPQSYYYSNYYPTTPAAAYYEAQAAAVGEAPFEVTSDVVTQVQMALRARRFYLGPIDGVSGASTRSAIRTYAATVGLPSNGAIDANLLASLGLQ